MFKKDPELLELRAMLTWLSNWTEVHYKWELGGSWLNMHCESYLEIQPDFNVRATSLIEAIKRGMEDGL